MECDLDLLYSDLDNFGTEAKVQSTEVNHQLNEKLNKVSEHIIEVENKNKELQEINKNLKHNISLVLLTAKNELSRKKVQIDELVREKDSILFRRGYPKQKRKNELKSKYTQTEFNFSLNSKYVQTEKYVHLSKKDIPEPESNQLCQVKTPLPANEPAKLFLENSNQNGDFVTDVVESLLALSRGAASRTQTETDVNKETEIEKICKTEDHDFMILLNEKEKILRELKQSDNEESTDKKRNANGESSDIYYHKKHSHKEIYKRNEHKRIKTTLSSYKEKEKLKNFRNNEYKNEKEYKIEIKSDISDHHSNQSKSSLLSSKFNHDTTHSDHSQNKTFVKNKFQSNEIFIKQKDRSKNEDNNSKTNSENDQHSKIPYEKSSTNLSRNSYAKNKYLKDDQYNIYDKNRSTNRSTSSDIHNKVLRPSRDTKEIKENIMETNSNEGKVLTDNKSKDAKLNVIYNKSDLLFGENSKSSNMDKHKTSNSKEVQKQPIDIDTDIKRNFKNIVTDRRSRKRSDTLNPDKIIDDRSNIEIKNITQILKEKPKTENEPANSIIDCNVNGLDIGKQNRDLDEDNLILLSNVGVDVKVKNLQEEIGKNEIDKNHKSIPQTKINESNTQETNNLDTVTNCNIVNNIPKLNRKNFTGISDKDESSQNMSRNILNQGELSDRTYKIPKLNAKKTPMLDKEKCSRLFNVNTDFESITEKSNISDVIEQSISCVVTQLSADYTNKDNFKGENDNLVTNLSRLGGKKIQLPNSGYFKSVNATPLMNSTEEITSNQCNRKSIKLGEPREKVQKNRNQVSPIILLKNQKSKKYVIEKMRKKQLELFGDEEDTDTIESIPVKKIKYDTNNFQNQSKNLIETADILKNSNEITGDTINIKEIIKCKNETPTLENRDELKPDEKYIFENILTNENAKITDENTKAKHNAHMITASVQKTTINNNNALTNVNTVQQPDEDKNKSLNELDTSLNSSFELKIKKTSYVIETLGNEINVSINRSKKRKPKKVNVL